MTRAENRHHEKRIKAKWRRRIRREPNIPKGRDLSRYKSAPPEVEVEQRAVRRAHHPCCPCWICQHPTGEESRLPKPAERRGEMEPDP